MNDHAKAVERTFESLAVGESVSCTRTITGEMVADFARLTGDYNPLHTDTAYAESTPHKKIVTHGMLTASLLSELVGMHLPGKYSLILSQTTRFIKPVSIDDQITVTGTISQKSVATQTVTVDIHMKRATDEVLNGNVIVRVDNPKK